MDLDDIDNFITSRVIKCANVSAVEPSARRTAFDGEISFGKTISYRNGLPWPVTIVEQSGIGITIPRLESGFKSTNDLEVDIRYNFNHLVNFDIYHLLSDTNNAALSPELRAMQVHLKEGRLRPYAHNEFIITYSITKDQLNPHSSAVYVKELNHTFYIKKENEIRQVVHPHSDLGEKLHLELQNIGAFQYGIEIVDPENRLGERYINIANRVFRVIPNKISHKQPGVYVNLTIGSEIVLENSPANISDFYTFQDAIKYLNLYSSAQEAHELGNLEEMLKRRKLDHESNLLDKKIEHSEKEYGLKEMDQGLLLQQKALQSLEANNKQVLQEMKNVAAIMESSQQEKSYEQQLVKLEREAYLSNMQFRQTIQKADRNDMSEMIKWIPLIALAVGAVVKTLL